MTNWAPLEASYEIVETPHPIGPLSVLLSPSDQYVVEAGNTFEISLTVNNQGSRGAIIDIYIDETSQAFCQWCLNPYERLALEVGHSSEVRFKVAIPVQTLPGVYDYLIVVDSPNHYPEDTPLRYPATVQVLPPVKSAVNLNDATFATRPETSSDQPIILEPTIPVEMQVIVHNRSNRVDQFRLEVTDLPNNWYQIIYPEGLGELGLVVDTEHLALNPDVRGVIRLVITCPANALAGQSLVTLRLRSTNNPELLLMDMLYFETPTVYDLKVRAEAIIRKVKRQFALFHLHIANGGNTAREITLQAQEDREDPFFTYQIEPLQLRIPSKTTVQTILTASPTNMRRRAWIGGARSVTFRLGVNDHHGLPLPEAPLAEILWERRPWWHIALVILLGVGIFGAVAGIFWWFFMRPPALPKVVEFGSNAPTYYQQQDDFVRLLWRIENPQQIHTLELRSEANQGTSATQPIIYDFSDGTPPELADYCVFEKTLSCSNVFTSARQPGNYRFSLTVLPKDDQARPVVAQTAQIVILPTPPPEIRTFAATQPRYWEALDPSSLESDAAATNPATDTMALNWQVTSVDQLSHLSLVGRLANGSMISPPQQYDLAEGLPKGLEKFCTLTSTDLICRALPINARTVGAYVFELNLFTPNSTEPIATAKTDPVQIVPAPVRIETFTINGAPAPTKYQVQESQDSVQLAWRVVGGPYTQVELLPNPGSVPLVGTLSYPLTANTQEVVILKVTSVRGEQITRSVTLNALQPESRLPSAAAEIETTLPPPPSPSANSSTPTASPAPAEEPSNPESSPASAEEPSSPESSPASAEEPSSPESLLAPAEEPSSPESLLAPAPAEEPSSPESLPAPSEEPRSPDLP